MSSFILDRRASVADGADRGGAAELARAERVGVRRWRPARGRRALRVAPHAVRAAPVRPLHVVVVVVVAAAHVVVHSARSCRRRPVALAGAAAAPASLVITLSARQCFTPRTGAAPASSSSELSMGWVGFGRVHYSNTHTHTHTRLTALFPGLPRGAGTRRVKPIWILLKQETMSRSGFSWAMCKSAPRSIQITTPTPTTQFFTGRMPCLPRNQQRQSTEGKGPLQQKC